MSQPISDQTFQKRGGRPRIDADQEFYLKSRGIKPAQAQELLVFGFFEEVLGKIENEQLHDQFSAIIREKFKQQ